ncbi:MAG: hypothetical protein ACI854_002585, partial [Arenicella sp.]
TFLAFATEVIDRNRITKNKLFIVFSLILVSIGA